jgi:dATP/dGTP diphosphohydrolase
MTTPEERKGAPMANGLLWYFPAALAEVAKVSKKGNDQHNPGESLHWARSKSFDHADCLIRHLADAGTLDSDGLRHTAKVAWRALAMLQVELEAAGAPLPRNARLPGYEESEQVHHAIDAPMPPHEPLTIPPSLLEDDDDMGLKAGEAFAVPVESLGRDA